MCTSIYAWDCIYVCVCMYCVRICMYAYICVYICVFILNIMSVCKRCM